MTLVEIVNIISKQLGEVARQVTEQYDVFGGVVKKDEDGHDVFGADGSNDYKIIVCPERIFVGEYLEQRNEELETIIDGGLYSGDLPNFTKYGKTIFFVIKANGGERNMAVSNMNIYIQALSEENDFMVARDILDAFVVKYNYQYLDGITQAYFNPETSSSQEDVYTGFRMLLSVRGFVRVPEKGFIFVNKVNVGFTDDEGNEISYDGVPFLECGYTYNGQPDPQAFAGGNGATVALIRQSTETVTFSTYLIYNSELSDDDGELAKEKAQNAFTKAVLGAKAKMNRKFHVVLETIVDGLPITDDYYVLVSAPYSQELADLSTWTLTFARTSQEE